MGALDALLRDLHPDHWYTGVSTYIGAFFGKVADLETRQNYAAKIVAFLHREYTLAQRTHIGPRLVVILRNTGEV